MKKGTNCIFSVIMALIMTATAGITSNTVNAMTQVAVEIDGAPIVIVDDINEIPASVKRNIEICRQKGETDSQMFPNMNSSSHIIDATGYEIAPCVEVYPTILGLLHKPQDTNFYCGYACLQSILSYHGIEKTQSVIASEAYSVNDSLAWFVGTNAQATNSLYYPAVSYLNSLIDYQYSPYNWYFDANINAQKVGAKIKNNIDYAQEGVLICGTSYGNNYNGSRLPNYPTTANITHWILSDGYSWEIDTQSITEISFIDPAKSSAISWSGSITAYARTDLDNIYNFCSTRGIIY